MKLGSINLVLLILWCYSNLLFAADICKQKMTLACTYNPQPSSEDFSLPMPGSLEMVFKKVVVPGAEFWGNPQRLVAMGDVSGDFGDEALFEGVQQLPIFGTFYDAQQKHWYYYLGKYEVTVAQFVTVMGNGNLTEGLAYFYKASGDQKLTRDLEKARLANKQTKMLRLLATPLTWVSWYDYQAFLRRYNLWCYNHPACLTKLPRLPQRLDTSIKSQPDELPGFIRLPTELEWEYAARGGLAALQELQNDRPLYQQVLPFKRSQVKKFAWVKPHNRGKGTTRIGRWQSTYGFHDLFGNVQELMAQTFTAEIIQGKVGALTVRGGSFNDNASRLRSSLRTELGIYQRDREGNMIEVRSPTTGIRVSIGSLVVQSPRFRDDIKAEYQAYTDPKKGFRHQTAAGKSNNDDLMRADDDLQNAHNIIQNLEQNNQQLKAQIGQVRNTLDKANQQAQENQATKALIDTLAKDNNNLKNQLSAIKRALNEAGQKLEDGTRDVCDKLANNAVLILKTAGWHYARATARKKLIDKIKKMDISGRTRQIQSAMQTYEEHLENFDRNFDNYAELVEELGGYPNRFIEPVIKNIRTNDDVLILESLNLLEKHVARANQGIVNIPKWKEEVEKMALKKGVFRN
jgi:DNA-binding ferritin-like protein